MTFARHRAAGSSLVAPAISVRSVCGTRCQNTPGSSITLPADGSRIRGTVDGQRYFALYDGHARDRGHLNETASAVAAARLTKARADLKQRAEELDLPVENLLTPDYLRRLLWEPPAGPEDDDLPVKVAERLAELGARQWQVDLTRDLLVAAIRDARPEEDPPAAAPPADA